MSRSMSPGWSNCTLSNLVFLGIFQALTSIMVNDVVSLMWDKIKQLIVVCQSVCLDLKWIETLWYVSGLTLDMPCICACVWVLGNLKRCTHLSVMKCDWEALYNNALHGTYWPDLFWTSTMSVASRIWFLGLPLNEQYVQISAVDLPLASSRPLVIDTLSLIYWICLTMCSKVWCLLWHWRHTCFEHVWFLVNVCMQLKLSPDCLAWLKRCLACIMRNLSHLKILCDILHKDHCSSVVSLEQNLPTLFPVHCNECEMLGTTFSDWVVWSCSKALHLDSRNVNKSAVVGVSAREAVISSHSRCVSGSSVASINSHSMIMLVKHSCCSTHD